MRLLFAFLRRDFLIARSYKLNTLFVFVGGLVTLAVTYFLSRTMGEIPLLRRNYGADYFSFSLLGMAVASLLAAFQHSFSRRLVETQMDGSLEVLLGAPRPTLQIITLLGLYPLLSAIAGAVLLVVAGKLFFGASLSIHPAGVLLTLAAAAPPFMALGLLSAAFVLVFKRGDPFIYVMSVATYLVSGVAYPREVLPPILQGLAKLVPATYALDALRLSTLQRAPLAALVPSWIALLAFAAVLWPLAGVALALARRHAERVGTLPQA